MTPASTAVRMISVVHGSRMACVTAAVLGIGLGTFALAVPTSGARSHRAEHAARASASLTYVGGDSIYSLRADGTRRQQLAGSASPLHGGPSDAQPVFSHDGLRIAFVRGLNADTGQGESVWVMTADGSGKRRLASGSFPQFSPNGKRLLFVRELRAATNRNPLASTEIWVMNSNGSGQRRLTHGAQDLEAAWSPDGSTIAFQRTTNPGGTSHPLQEAAIWVMNADGSGQRRLTSGASDLNLVWSPNGSRIAFERATFDLTQHHGGSGTGILAAISTAIYAINADGSGLVKLADESGSPAFSPNGSTIAFASYRDQSGRSCGEDECSYNHEIYVMHSDGSTQTRITHSPSEDQNPVWTPDGRAIVFSSDRANYPALTYQGVDSDLYIMPSTGGCPLRLTDSSLSVYTATVAPHGATPPAVLHAKCRNRAGYDPNRLRPEIDTNQTAAARNYPFPIYYLGETFNGIMLTDVQEFPVSDPIEGSYRSPFFDYSRCASGPRCGPEIQLQLEPICKDGDLRHLFPYGPPDVIIRKRGALVLISHSPDDNQAEIYLGTLGILMRGTDSQIRHGVTHLREFGQQHATGLPLPSPRLPASSLDLTRRIERYGRAHDIAATARRFHLDPSRIRAALKIQRLISPADQANASHC